MPDLMRRAASSRPRRWGICTTSGCDTGVLRCCEAHIGTRAARASTQTKGPRRGPFVARICAELAGAAARVPDGAAATGATLAGGALILMAGRIAGGAGLAGPAALVLHLLAGRIAGRT